jgi:hypothetical protein
MIPIKYNNTEEFETLLSRPNIKQSNFNWIDPCIGK